MAKGIGCCHGSNPQNRESHLGDEGGTSWRGNQQTLRKQHECTAAAAVVVVQNKKTKETKQEWSVWYNDLPLLLCVYVFFSPFFL